MRTPARPVHTCSHGHTCPHCAHLPAPRAPTRTERTCTQCIHVRSIQGVGRSSAWTPPREQTRAARPGFLLSGSRAGSGLSTHHVRPFPLATASHMTQSTQRTWKDAPTLSPRLGAGMTLTTRYGSEDQPATPCRAVRGVRERGLPFQHGAALPLARLRQSRVELTAGAFRIWISRAFRGPGTNTSLASLSLLITAPQLPWESSRKGGGDAGHCASWGIKDKEKWILEVIHEHYRSPTMQTCANQ